MDGYTKIIVYRVLKGKKYKLLLMEIQRNNNWQKKNLVEGNIQNQHTYVNIITQTLLNLKFSFQSQYIIFLCDIKHYFPQYLPARAYLALLQHSPLVQGMYQLGRILHPPSQWMFVLIVLLKLL